MGLVSAKAQAGAGKTIYVDDDAAGANDGSSWLNAYKYLQDALADANIADKPVEIRVAQGIYKPDQCANQTAGDREATFQLINGVTLKGGYAGSGSPDPNARDIVLYETILCGDIGNVGYVWDNCYHVVTANDTDSSTVLDGLTITGGYADQGPDPTPFSLIEPGSCGAGLYNNGSLTLRNCTFNYNIAKVFGGGIYNHFSRQQQRNVLTAIGGGGGMANAGEPNIVNCIFSKNSATSGGGMLDHGYSVLENCTFVENLAFDIRLGDGGGICTTRFYSDKRISLNGCLFRDNRATVKGGGMSGFGTLTNCKFIRNEAYLESGGGIEGGVIVTRSTFIGNTAPQGGGLYGNGILTNCIFSGNSASKGGGIYVHYQSPVGRPKHTYTANDVGLYSNGDILFNCTFTGNVAVAKGHPPGYLAPIMSPSSLVIEIWPKRSTYIARSNSPSELNSWIFLVIQSATKIFPCSLMQR